MRFAIPISNGVLCAHFGHCEKFALIDADTENKIITAQETITAPEHQPGLLPRWLAGKKADFIIAGGMGMRAQNLFTENGIQVVVGAPVDSPENLVASYLEGTLRPGDNICDH